ncbi:MAG: chorismate synthase, partial [Clostridia bacterium]|nr:chorismate synthase [Clostridia bacterium]
MKKVLSIILAVVMVVCALPFSLTASAEVTSGTTGDCTWTLDGGVLTISGNGAMGNYDSWSTYPPWGKSITKVIIEEGVTNIGEYSFYNCANLASVTIPSSVTSIGSLAFYNCTGLIRVDTPDLSAWLNIDFGSVSDNPTYYTKSLYVNGKSAKDIIIPDGITSIKDYAFYNCANITSVEIPNSVTSIGEETFYGCTGLTSATIPNSVTSIGGYAFYDCGELVNIDIPKSVTNIGEGAFFNCYGLTNVVIPNSIVSILARTFQFCSKLESVFIPKSVMNIANDAFYYDNGVLKTKTNFSGGINGGISNGMPIIFRCAVRPTPTISKKQ